MTIQWLTTVPNPRLVGRQDGGMCGWHLHAVALDGSATAEQAHGIRAFCGLIPRHGWGVDLFIDEPCLRCVRIALARGVPVPEDVVCIARRREDMRRRLRTLAG